MNNFNFVHLGLEDREFLRSFKKIPQTFYGVVSIPDEVTLDDIKLENQSSMGSCQGHSISTCCERLLTAQGNPIQLSRIYAYLATQKKDGLLGSDSGSTISGGLKVALEGIPPESLIPYPVPAVYPDRDTRAKILAQAEAGKPYAAKSAWQVPKDPDRIREFIGGGGAISIGIRWYGGIIPSDRTIRRYAPPRASGGHAVALLGYRKDGVFRFMNSHGDGQFLVTPEALMQMLNDSFTAAVGVLGSKEAKPVDWLNNSPLFGK